jgi:site-specific DNA recombinase
VEVFDQQSVSFVSITQSFNTTTSMGRLTLNVLLSFAQFEREVIGERVRDKISASKKKGIWVGGPVPMGYRVADKKVSIVPAEAKTVRMIFERYLALKSISVLQNELDQKDIRTRKQKLSNGRIRGGCRYGKGTLYHLLKNRFYVGEVAYKGSINKGEHEPIIERATFEVVQKLLSDNAVERNANRHSSNALLTGLLFDDRGNRMTPTYSRKHGARYRYYVSHALLQSRKAEAGSVTRVSATEIEENIVIALQQNEVLSQEEANITPELLHTAVEKITLRENELKIELTDKSIGKKGILFVQWSKKYPAAPKAVIHAPVTSEKRLGPEARDALLTAIARARKWITGLESGAVSTISEIAEREGNVERHIRLLLPLAFTPPALITSLIEESAPHDLTVTWLAKHIPFEWDTDPTTC